MKQFKYISSKKKDKIKVFHSPAESGELERTSGFRIEMFSNKTLTAEGCIGVSDYRDDYVKIRVKKGHIVFTGSGLNITFFENKTININGLISNVEFCV